MQSIGIIPARFSSTRFPGKPLVNIDGKTMIQRVYLQASKATLLSKVLVATDDKRIFDHVRSFGGLVKMTRKAHQNGTSRCAEVAKLFQDMEAVVNIQGDEPFIDPRQIDACVQVLQYNSNKNIASLAKKINKYEELTHPNIVKVVFNTQKEALYFSRSPIPYLRGVAQKDWLKKGNFYKHIGLYAYRRATLLEIAQLPLGKLEQSESLEQLRWLENGYKIGIALTDLETFGIDTPQDLEKLKN